VGVDRELGRGADLAVRLLSVGPLPPRSGGPVHGGVATTHATLLTGFVQADGIELVGVVPRSPLTVEADFPVYARPDGMGTAHFYEDLLERLRPDAVLMHHFANTIGVTHARLRPPAAAIGVAHSWHNITLRSGEERSRALEVTAEAMTGLRALVFGSDHSYREGNELGLRYSVPAETIYPPLQLFYSESGIDVEASTRRGVSYVGSLVDRKNPAALVEATAGLPGLEACLAGHGDLEEPLRSLIESLSIADRVRIAHLDDSGIRDLLLRSQAMCLPSRSETFGLAYIEALACGTPVIGFGPTIREIRDEMGIEIGEPLETGAPEEVAAAVERVLAARWDPAELRRATLEAFGLRRITDRFVELLSRSVAMPVP
jgi:glycosyltransferase involved in cell wall biosynthesis